MAVEKSILTKNDIKAVSLRFKSYNKLSNKGKIHFAIAILLTWVKYKTKNICKNTTQIKNNVIKWIKIFGAIVSIKNHKNP